MRADRLLSILMLLQRNGQMSAPALAAELGVSVRTIYRDADALAAAGIPIYGEAGAAGGYRLVENYRTTLTGLTQHERDLLPMLTIPEPLAALDAGQTLKAALLKVFAALRPPPDDRVTQRIYLDWVWWGQGYETPPHLHTLYQAIWRDRRVMIRYRLANGIDIERAAAPYGLVAKGGAWYLVYAGEGRLHHHRVSALAGVTLTDEPFERLAAFDLETYWKAVCAEVEQQHRQFEVVLRVASAALPELPHHFTSGGWQISGVDADGWMRLVVWCDSLYHARTAILGLGGAAEVIAPEALRLTVRDFAAQIVKRYG